MEEGKLELLEEEKPHNYDPHRANQYNCVNDMSCWCTTGGVNVDFNSTTIRLASTDSVEATYQNLAFLKKHFDWLLGWANGQKETFLLRKAQTYLVLHCIIKFYIMFVAGYA